MNEILKSLLVHLIGSWNTEYNSNPNLETTQSKYYKISCRFICFLKQVERIPSNLKYCNELFPFISSKDISMLLLSIWNFISRIESTPNDKNAQLENDFNSQKTMKSIFCSNISKLPLLYWRLSSSSS